MADVNQACSEGDGMLPGAEGIARALHQRWDVGCVIVLEGSCTAWGEELSQCCATHSGFNFLLVFQLEVHVIFEGNKIFQAEMDLWGVRSCLL